MVTAMPDFGDLKVEKREFQIKVDNREDGYFYLWEPDKFVNRVEIMRAQFNDYVESGGTQTPDFSDKEQDPFWDPPEPVLIGKAYKQMKNLSYTLENDEDVRIFTANTHVKTGEQGTIKCSYWPCDYDGTGEPDDDVICDDP